MAVGVELGLFVGVGPGEGVVVRVGCVEGNELGLSVGLGLGEEVGV